MSPVNVRECSKNSMYIDVNICQVMNFASEFYNGADKLRCRYTSKSTHVTIT